MTVVEVLGAPRDQGIDQGSALRSAVRSAVRADRNRRGSIRWVVAARAARLRAGRTAARLLPQQHERLEGIARGAGIPLAPLQLLEATEHCSARGAGKGPCIEAAIVSSPEVGPPLLVRASTPDAGGFSSVELTAAPWSGAVAGCNSEGVAVLCLEDEPRGLPSVRLLVQEVLLRAPSAATACEHLRRRARYLDCRATLLLTDPSARPMAIEIRPGTAALSGSSLAESPARSNLWIDAGARALVWRDPSGFEQSATAPQAPLESAPDG